MAIQEPVLYAICDGEKARFLRFDGKELRTARSFTAHGAETDAAGEIGSIKDPKTDPHVQLKERFAREMAGEINAAFSGADALRGLVLAAPPHTLHEIRAHLHKTVAERILAAESKDLTNTPDHDMLAHFNRPATGWVLA
ncbi:host attachment protein [Acidomonas methanolica]|uniref:host attachment protein n=1 Tax=Acidomonas methanolica TaxID=437 RepID=UPI002119EA5F|nr:host attachment protein [Acidomonas methanolica]MCQ9154032.1 host attachment protein [Acidomonas methanolica]